MAPKDGPPQDLTIGQLTPQSRDFNVKAKVLNVGEEREIPGKFDSPSNRVAEALIGDDSANVVLSLWNQQIGEVNEGDTIQVENGYVSLVRGHMRVNVGKFGRLTKVDADIAASEDNKNLSDAEHEDTRRERRGFGGGGGGGRGGGFGDRGGRGGFSGPGPRR